MLKIYPKIGTPAVYSGSASSKAKAAERTNFCGHKAIQKASVSMGEIILGMFNDGKTHLTVNTQDRIKETAKKSKEIAEQAEKAVTSVRTLFETYLKDEIDKTIQLIIRSKSQYGITKKATKKTLEQCADISSAIIDLQNTKFSIEELLPEKQKNESLSFKKMRTQTEILLKNGVKGETLNIKKIQELIIPKNFREKYGTQGTIFAKNILQKTEELLNQKAIKLFSSITSMQKEAPTSQVNDAVGTRFVIKKPKEDFNSLPLLERINAYEKYMRQQMDKLTDMFMEFCKPNKNEETVKLMQVCNISDMKMKKLISYGGANQYLRGENIQRLKELGGMEAIEKTLENGYITNQGRLEMTFDHKGKNLPIKVEFQIRGEEVNKFAEVEHIPYDLREGKQIDLTKYNPEQRILINKIQKESKKLSQNEQLNTEYNKYLEKCYDYHFSKEYGVTLPKPKLPEGINEVMDMDSLFKLSHN